MNVKTRLSVAAVAALAATAGTLSPALATAHTAASAAPRGVTVYQGKVVNQHAVLGPQSAPTTLTRTAVLPAGTYLVTATVAAVISSHDQIVCAAYPNGGNDGVFGTAGNPGTGGIYGTAAMTDTVTVDGTQSIGVTCNSFNYGLGTYAANATIEATRAAAVG